MAMESAPEAQRDSFVPTPTGLRRLTPSLLKADRTAESFAGLPDGVTVHGQLLAAFKAAAPRLGVSARLVHAVDWLFRFIQPQDWGRGGRPRPTGRAPRTRARKSAPNSGTRGGGFPTTPTRDVRGDARFRMRFEHAEDFVGDVGIAAQYARPRLVDDTLYEWPHFLQSILGALQHRLDLRTGRPHPLAQPPVQWPTPKITSGTPATTPSRMLPADVTYETGWESANNFKLTMLFNGGGSDDQVAATGSDSLLTAWQASKSNVLEWVNHTYSHEFLGCQQNLTTVPWSCQTDASGNDLWVPQEDPSDLIDDRHPILERSLRQRNLGVPDHAATVSLEHSELAPSDLQGQHRAHW